MKEKKYKVVIKTEEEKIVCVKAFTKGEAVEKALKKEANNEKDIITKKTLNIGVE